MKAKRPAWGASTLALVLFALSGCAGLIYQSIWTQYLGLFLGHAAYAQSLVLAIFMGGMAVGAWCASRAVHWRNLLRAYAWVELAIGIAAAMFHAEFVGATGAAYDSVFPALRSALAVGSFQWLLASTLILPQSILLGMTFPLMCNGLMRRLRIGTGSILSGLYFTNSIGAAAGALLATFVLLPGAGLPGAMRAGALLNVVVAVIAFVLARDPEPAVAGERTQAGNGAVASGHALFLVAAAITGATSFVYEIGWIRMLSLAFGATVHAFELMLAAFIGGLAFGGLWIRSRIDGFASPLRAGGFVQVLMGLAALASLALYGRTFDWVAWLMRVLSRDEAAYQLYNIATAVVAILIMVPAAFFAGMTLPLFTLALLRAGGGEASVGRVYAANTVGAIVGVFLAMHVLIPDTGLKLAMIFGAVADIALGLVLMRRAPATARSRPQYLGALAASAMAVALVLAFVHFDPAELTSGVYRTGVPHIAVPRESVVYYKDGKTASIGVIANKANGTLRIVTNGKPDALLAALDSGVQSPDEATMILAAVLPLSLHKEARDVANIGFGSGLTVHTLLGDSRLRKVDTIEIEPAMYEGAKAFGKRVERAYTDPRAHVYFEDAKAYFASHASKYDIIVSEPSNPWVSGVASLFTREWYRFVPRHLNKGGLLVQWIQLYEINEELVASVVNALNESFQDFRLFLANDSDLIVVARADGAVGALDERVFDEAGLRQSLRRIDITDLATLRQHAIGDRRSFAPLMAALSTRVNSDFHPILTLEAPKARFSGQSARGIQMLPVADLPILEGVGGLDSVGPSSQIGWTLYYLRTQRIADAAVIAAALAGRGTDKPVPVDASPYIALLSAYGAACAGDASIAALDAIHRLATRTIPFLDQNELRGAWIEPAWLRCQIGDASVAAMLDVARALSRRDGRTTLEAATRLLDDSKAQLPDPMRDYLLRAAMLGAVMSRDFADVAKIDDRFGRDVSSTDSSFVQRLYMRAVADAAAPRAHATDDRKPRDP
jgi:spermidine synthase